MIIRGGRLFLTERDPAQGPVPADRRLLPLAGRGRRPAGGGHHPVGHRQRRLARHPGRARGRRPGASARARTRAKFDGMPRSAVDTGVVDLVLAPEEHGRRARPLPASTTAAWALGPDAAHGRGRRPVAHLRAAAARVRGRLRRLQEQHRGPADRAPPAAQRQPRTSSEYLDRLGAGSRRAALAVQGPAHRRDPLLPRPGGVRAPAAAT